MSVFSDITLGESCFPSKNHHSYEKAMEPCMSSIMEGGKGRLRISSHSAFELYFTNKTLKSICQNLTEYKTFRRIYSISTHYTVSVLQVLAMILTI